MSDTIGDCVCLTVFILLQTLSSFYINHSVLRTKLASAVSALQGPRPKLSWFLKASPDGRPEQNPNSTVHLALGSDFDHLDVFVRKTKEEKTQLLVEVVCPSETPNVLGW